MDQDTAVSAERIIETVKRYSARVCGGMQYADQVDAEQETIAYMLQALWSERAFRRTIWNRLICISTRRRQRIRRAGLKALSGGETARLAAPDSRMVIAELYAIACRDDLDAIILKRLTAGDTWQQAADALGVERSTLARRLSKMRGRLAAHGVRLLGAGRAGV